MYQFVTDNVEGLGKKRKASRRACENCRSKRKKCYHFAQEDAFAGAKSAIAREATDTSAGTIILRASDSSGGMNDTSLPCSSTSKEGEQATADMRAEDRDDPPQGQLQFIGELSPTAVFEAERGPRNLADFQDSHGVGVWVDRSNGLSGKTPRANSRGMTEPAREQASYRPEALQSQMHLLSDQCAALVPPDEAFEALKSIYDTKIHPLYPVLLEDPRRIKRPHIEKCILMQAICILASADPSAKPFLRLPGLDEALQRGIFSRRLADTVKTAMDLDLVTDELVAVQVSALMALHVDGTIGSVTSARYCAAAVFHAQTAGLHLSRPNSRVRDALDRLFSCVWAVDRINAAVNGRPVLLHHWDLGVDLKAIIEGSEPAFRLFLTICVLLDRVIAMYRPQHQATTGLPNLELKPFEELVLEASAGEADSAILASLEVFYHAVAILSFRQETHSFSIAPIAQTYSADKINLIVAKEFEFRLTMWILTPYAVSLSLSTAYRDLRNTRVHNHRRRAYSSFHANCQLLDQLSPLFSSAQAMAQLAKNTLAEMNRVTSSLASTRELQAGAGTTRQVVSPTSASADVVRRDLNIAGIAYDPEDFELRSDANHARMVDTSPGMAIFSSIPNQDLFTQFDPDFDLENVDAVLQGNLDLSLPWFGE